MIFLGSQINRDRCFLWNANFSHPIKIIQVFIYVLSNNRISDQREIEKARAKGIAPILTFSPSVWIIGIPIPQRVPKSAPVITSVIK